VLVRPLVLGEVPVDVLVARRELGGLFLELDAAAGDGVSVAFEFVPAEPVELLPAVLVAAEVDAADVGLLLAHAASSLSARRARAARARARRPIP
jgi:hypothetical protein